MVNNGCLLAYFVPLLFSLQQNPNEEKAGSLSRKLCSLQFGDWDDLKAKDGSKEEATPGPMRVAGCLWRSQTLFLS